MPFDRTTLFDTAGLPTQVKQDAHLVKIGLNYHFNRSGADAGETIAPLPFKALPPTENWRFEVGSRY